MNHDHVAKSQAPSGAYPFLAYGTDWLAFAHIVIAVFFIGPLVKPKDYDTTESPGWVRTSMPVELLPRRQ
jgi:hypothetical protein